MRLLPWNSKTVVDEKLITHEADVDRLIEDARLLAAEVEAQKTLIVKKANGHFSGKGPDK